MLYDKYTASECAGTNDEALQLIAEAVLCEQLSNEEIQELTESRDVTRELVDMGIVQEKTIVRLDKKAKISRATMQAIFQIAKEKNDRDYRKLVTIWRMERLQEAKLRKKYYALALKRAKLAVAQMGKHKKDTPNAVVAKAVKGAKKQFNSDAAAPTAK